MRRARVIPGTQGKRGPQGPKATPYFFRFGAGVYAADRFGGVFSQAEAPNELPVSVPIMSDGHLRTLRIRTLLGNVGIAPAVFVVRVSGADSLLAATIPVGSSSAGELAISIPVLAGVNLLSVRLLGNGTDLPSRVWVGVELES